MMSTGRQCRTCATPETRTKDAQGREATNISPLSGQCVDCLVQSAASARVMPSARVLPFDAKAAAAGRDDE